MKISNEDNKILDKRKIILYARNFIQSGNTKKALKLICNNTNILGVANNDIILLSNQYKNIERRGELGLGYDNEKLNEIVYAILQVLDNLNTEEKIVELDNEISRDFTRLLQKNKAKTVIEFYRDEEDNSTKLNINLTELKLISVILVLVLLGVFVSAIFFFFILIPLYFLIDINVDVDA